MRKNKYHVYLTSEEMRTVVKALVDVINSLIQALEHFPNIAKCLISKVTELSMDQTKSKEVKEASINRQHHSRRSNMEL